MSLAEANQPTVDLAGSTRYQPSPLQAARFSIAQFDAMTEAGIFSNGNDRQIHKMPFNEDYDAFSSTCRALMRL